MIGTFQQGNLGVVPSSTGGPDPDVLAFFAACTAAGASVTNTAPYFYENMYTSVISALKSYGQWTKLDSLFIDFTGDYRWSLIDVRNPSRTATIHNGTSAKFTVNKGWQGGSSFYIDTTYNPGDGGTYQFTQNDSSFGFFQLLDPDGVSGNTSTGVFNSDFSVGSLGRNDGYDSIYVNAAYPGVGAAGSTYKKPKLDIIGWNSATRSSSSVVVANHAGVRYATLTMTSTAVLNLSFYRFTSNVNGSPNASGYNTGSQGGWFAGNGSVDDKKVQLKLVSRPTGRLFSC